METKNVLLAIILSTIVLVFWATFFEPPIIEQQAPEKQIVENPQYWLWSHRRWKHKRPSDLKQYE